MNNNCTLKKVENKLEWNSFHAIRKEILFDKRGRINYNRNHPDDYAKNNYPFLLILAGKPIGVVRIDLDEKNNLAYMRTVAIIENRQRKGYGKILIQLVEEFCISMDYKLILVNAAPTAIDFYKKSGYELVQTKESNTKLMKKNLF